MDQVAPEFWLLAAIWVTGYIGQIVAAKVEIKHINDKLSMLETVFTEFRSEMRGGMQTFDRRITRIEGWLKLEDRTER